MTPRPNKAAQETVEDPFISDDDAPPPKTGMWFKTEDGGTYTFRFLMKPVVGMVGWLRGKNGAKDIAVRKRKGEKFAPGEVTLDADNELKYFLAGPIYNHGIGRVQMAEITQSTIYGPILDLARNPKWGSPLNYDITLTRKKDGGKTVYTVMPNPREPLPAEAQAAWDEVVANGFDLSRMYVDGKPFNATPPATEGGAAGLLPGTPVGVVSARAFAILHELVSLGVYGNGINAKSDDGKARRRRLWSDLLERPATPETMTAEDWNAIANKLDAILKQHTPPETDSDIPF